MERSSLRRFYGRQILKGALFASTALVLPAIAPRLALAQIAPNTTPQGGAIVGGSASIAQTPGTTTINQSSQNAAINWQSFNVGAQAKVQFNQPNAAATALNRVVGGNLSIINGQINANGQIVLINQSGVVFGKGSQVNAESVVVSTSDIATSDFMAGKMNFTGAPKPGAQIINNGNITARDAGLVGLVAPQVANNGLITASLGQVILAGGSAFTLDLYGDRLISLDVTQAVRAVDIGGKTLPALVTNNGLIIADGGKITLTAQAADALVTQLIAAGGTLRADTVGAQTGTISVQGIGGNISIAGSLLARGTAAGTKGGAVQALADGTVALAPGATINVSGAAGGGIAAIGTDISRAQQGPADKTAPRAAFVSIAAGAAIHADATARGNAGTVTVLSHDSSNFAGAITAQGGPEGGNGGLVELSSDGVIDLSGTVLATAINGQPGEILLDPATLIVTVGGQNSTTASKVSPTYLDNLAGDIVLSASNEIDVFSDINLSKASSLTLTSGGDVSIAAFISIGGSLEIDASTSIAIGPSFSVVLGQDVFSSTGGIDADNILLNAGTGIQISAPLIAANAIQIENANGDITEGSVSGFVGLTPTIISGALQTPLVTGGTATLGGNVLLSNVNAIATLSNIILAGNHTLVVNDAAPLVITGNVAANDATFVSSDTTPADPFGFSITGALDAPGQLIFDSAKLVSEAATATISTALLSLFGDAAHGTVSLLGASNDITALGSVNAIDSLSLDDNTNLTLASPVTIAKTFAFAGDGIIETGTGALDVPLFSAASLTGDLLLTNLNTIATLSGVIAAGTLSLDDAVALTILDDVTARDIFLTAPTLALGANTLTAGALATPGTLALTANKINAATGLALNAAGGTIALAPLTGADAINLTTGTTSPAGLLIGPVLLDAITAGSEAELVLGNAQTTGTIGFGAALAEILDFGTATVDAQSSGAIDLAAGLITAGTFAFDGAGLNQAASGTLNAGLVTGNGGAITGNVLLDGAGNGIHTISNISISGNHELSVFDTLALSAGALQANTIALTAGTLTLDGNIAASNLFTLASTGGILQSAGSITTGSLTGTASVDIALGDAGNSFGTLGALAATGDILLDSAAFKIAGTVATPGILTLEGAGATELTGSSLQAATLTSAGHTISGDVDLTAGGNTIGLLTNFLVGGGFGLNLDDTGLLNLAGTVAAGHASLVSDTLALGGALNITNALTLGSANGLIQTAGTITAGTLASNGAITGGDVSLDQTNHIGTIGNFAVGAGNFTLGDAGTVAIAGTINVGTDEFLLDVGGLTETGVIDAGTLASETTLGNISLLGANGIATLSGFALTGDFALNDTIGLMLDGRLSTGATKTVSFGAPGVTEASGGEIDAGTLASIGTIGGDLLLSQTNTIGALNGLNLTGTLDLADTAPSLSIGNVQAKEATFANEANSTFGITGFLSVANELLLDIPGAVLRESGSLTAGTLSTGGAVITSATLNGVNHIATLDSFAAAGTFSLTDQSSLDITSDLTAAGINLADATSLTIDALLQATTFGVALAAPSLVIDAAGGITVPNAGLVSVAADTFSNAGTITAPAGTFAIAPYSLTAIDLGGTAANELDLTATDFAIADLSELIIGTAAGHAAATLAIDDFSASASIALVSLFATGEISDNGLLAANAIAFSGAGFGQGAAGSIVTGTLSASVPITGDVSLANAANSIDSLGAITLTNGALTLLDSASLAVNGTLIAENITLDDSDAISLGAPVSVASAGTIKLIADSLTDAAAPITAGTVEIYPYTSGDIIDLGGSAIGGLELSPGLVSLISASLLAIGTTGGGLIYAESLVSITPAELLLTGGGIDFEGTLAGPGLLSLASAGAIFEAADAVIKFATIAGAGGDTGLGGQNTIGTIGDFSASGNIVLNDFASLVIDGLVQTTGDISLEGRYFREIASGTLAAATLNSGGTTIGGDVFLTNANSIGALDGLFVNNGGTLDFVDSQALTLGAVSAPNVTLTANSLDFEGAFTATSLLALQTTGGVTETAGAITAGTLVSLGSIGGDVLLTGDNSILSLGALSLGASGTLDLNDISTLAITGPLTAPIATLSAAGIDIAGNLDAATRLVLASTGDVTQTAGVITTTLLTGPAGIDGNLLLGGANVIGTLANISVGAGDTLALDDTANLTLAGAISAPYASFTAPTIDLAADLTASEFLGVGGAQITQTAGSITAGTLAGLNSIAGDVILTLANGIGTIAGLALGGTFELNNTVSLAIAGQLAAKSVQFTDPDTIFETGTGAITAGSLTSGAAGLGGDLRLTGANTIGTLGALSLTTGTLDLADTGFLEIAGSVTAPTATISAGSIDIAGALNGADLALASLGTVSESTGTIGVGTLVSIGPIGGDAYLTQTNVIGTLANFTMGTGASLSLTDAETLTLAGLVDAPNATFSAPGLIFDGTLDAGQVLALTSATSITEGANGDIIAGTLISGGHVDGDVFLLGTNSIGTIGNFAVSQASTFALNDGISIAVIGTLAGGAVTLAGAAIGIPGTILATGLLDLESPGNVTATGVIDTASFTSGLIGGNLSLAGANSIAAIGDLAVSGNALINDLVTLDLGGLLQVATGTLALQDSDGIFETSGAIKAATLTSGSATNGTMRLLAAGNAIGDLGNVSLGTGATFALADTGLLTINGTLAAPIATLSVPTLAIAGAIDGTSLDLPNDALVTETGTGAIAEATLTAAGATDGDILLTNVNAIGTLANITLGAGGTLAVLDSELLLLAGGITAPFATLSANGLQIDGNLRAAETLALGSTGAITEADTGTITAGTLISDGSITGPVSLLSGNSIATLGSFGVANSFAFKNLETYTIAGLVTASTLTLEGDGFAETTGAIAAATLTSGGTSLLGGVTLNNANGIVTLANFTTSSNLFLNNEVPLTLAGTIAAATLGLADTQNISQSGGAILASTLTSDGAQIGGDVSLNGPGNSIAVLGNFSAASLALFDTENLDIAANVSVAGSLAVGDTGVIEQTAGIITAATLTSDGGTIGENAYFNQPGNQIGAIGDFAAAGGLSVTDSENLDIAGAIDTGGLYLVDGGYNITQTGGSIATGILGLTGAGITLAQSHNNIATLGAASAFDLIAYGVSTVSGPVSATTATIASNGNLTIAGNIDVNGDLSLGSALILDQDAGSTITAGNASLTSDEQIELNGVDNAAGSFGALAFGGFTAAGDITAASVNLGADGAFEQAAGTIAGSSLRIYGQIGVAVRGAIEAGSLDISSSHTTDDEATTLIAASATLAGTDGVILNGQNSISGQLVAEGGSIYQASGGLIQAGTADLTSGNFFTTLDGRLLANTATLTAITGTGLDIGGGVSIAGALDLQSGAAISQTGGYITAGNITGSAGTGITLAGEVGTGNLAFTAGGNIAQSAAGLLNASNARLTGAGIALAGTDHITGSLAATGAFSQTGTLTAGTASLTGPSIALYGTDSFTSLIANGAFRQTGRLNAGGVTLSGTSAALDGTDDITGNLFARTGNFHQSGQLSAANAYITTAGDADLNGGIVITNALDILAGGNLDDNASALSAQTASFQAASIVLNGNNAIATRLTADATGGPIAQDSGVISAPTLGLTATGSIELGGGLTATNASLTAGGTISLRGNANVTDDLDLHAAGGIFAPGTLTAGTLTGAVTGAGDEQASFLGSERIGTIGSFIMQDSTFALDDRGPLTITGPLVANTVSITATGLLTLAGSQNGGLFITSPIAGKTQTTPLPDDSSITVVQGTDGATPQLIQTGMFYINAGPLAGQFVNFANQPATLFITMTPDGTVNFAPAPPDTTGLIAPSVELVLAAGNGGIVSGNVDLLTLLLLSGKATNLTGMLDGLTGEAASGKGNVLPFPKPVFQFNACPIGSVNCIILPLETLPPGNPLQNFDIDQHKKKRLDKNVTLPGVATRDF